MSFLDNLQKAVLNTLAKRSKPWSFEEWMKSIGTFVDEDILLTEETSDYSFVNGECTVDPSAPFEIMVHISLLFKNCDGKLTSHEAKRTFLKRDFTPSSIMEIEKNGLRKYPIRHPTN